MNIAILNMSDLDELEYTLSCLEKIHSEIIAAKIDLFVSKQTALKIKDNKYINNVFELDIENINIFNFKRKYDAMAYYKRKKYNIAIDTQGTLKSSYFNYLITGKTAGFSTPGIKGKIISSLYDEKVVLKHTLDKKTHTKTLLYKTFGFILEND